MKQIFAALLCLTLCGCTRQAEPDVLPDELPPAMAAGMYDPDHPMERAYPGEIRAYPLTLRKVHDVQAIGNDVLVFSGQGCTTLTLLTGDDLRETASVTLDFELSGTDPSLQIHNDRISFFDSRQRETVVLDNRLQTVRRITAPENMAGHSILSADESTLFYCTAHAVMAWDLQSGIRRTVKEFSSGSYELTALLWNDSILQCSISGENGTETLLFSAENGAELHRLSETVSLDTKDHRYFAVIPAGNQNLLIFGQGEDAAQLLLPEKVPRQQYYLPEDHAAVTVSASEESVELDYYELNTGILRANLTLDPLQAPKTIINSKGHSVYILAYGPAADCDILYRWDVLRQPPETANVTDYTAAFHSRETPDLEALERCREYAREIGEKHGITVLVWEDAAAVQPWDYRFEPEYLAPVLERELALLDQRLSLYPPEILTQTASHFTGLTIALVRQIIGTADSGSLNAATGIQFLEGTDAYVVITVGKYSEQALYHELFHAMETHILTESTALDPWNTLNPSEFSYGSSSDARKEFKIYLRGETRAFVDSYSMSYPKEDRARILENAILPGNRDVFSSEIMQRKLTAICRGIREAYGLKKCEETFLWEQYLVNPLTPKE